MGRADAERTMSLGRSRTLTLANDTPASSTSHSGDATIENQPAREEEVFTVFTSWEKWFLVILTSFGAMFSPLTATIYLPAIPTLTKVFHKSTELINITVTVYMIFQGLSPMLFGTLADNYGRRPIFAICLFVLACSCIGLALVPTSAYWLLIVLRCLQSAGSASTIALGAGVIGDISTPAERGGYFGVWNMGPNLGPALGPVIGGLLAQNLGWRSIFWFLCIASFVCFLVMVLFLPETLRAIVGNGSIIPSKIYRPVIPIVGRSIPNSSTTRPPKKPFKNPFLLFREWDIVLLLLMNGFYNAFFYSVLASLSSLFSKHYPHLSETQIGLCYLATSGGMVLGTLTNGRLLDIQYKKFLRQLATARGVPAESLNIREKYGLADDYPVEKARLLNLPPMTLLLGLVIAGYGWCVQYSVNLAAPLILQTVAAALTMSSMSASQTLIVDWLPNQGSSITACNNLLRCTIAAGCVAIMDVVLNAIKPGWTYVIFGALCFLIIPLIYLVIMAGPGRRKVRKAKAQLEEERFAAASARK
ncbi:MFS general substrate transporter [Cylindrobasidium torrendii FP15055 ss-10]|uniref:MFS general substrate transporter n=1 Tax=Cylindrobasidium torrendii FP15055 ss-10 TaxID=1314674 RepID=A0A0D7BTX9_9AGAR|nr:MFS general substrate transporter [Cylindrobasidium torrendii FP15055 ss-10]